MRRIAAQDSKTHKVYDKPSDFTYKINDAMDGVILTGFSDYELPKGVKTYSIVIPDEIEGLHVVDVDTRYLWGTFGRYGIKSVVFSDYIADLPEDGCFSYNGCSGLLESVTLPAYITKVRQRTFSTCEKLKYVDIPDAVTEISYLAFDGCESLESVRLPPSLVVIGNNAFCNCKALKSIELPQT